MGDRPSDTAQENESLSTPTATYFSRNLERRPRRPEALLWHPTCLKQSLVFCTPKVGPFFSSARFRPLIPGLLVFGRTSMCSLASPRPRMPERTEKAALYTGGRGSPTQPKAFYPSYDAKRGVGRVYDVKGV